MQQRVLILGGSGKVGSHAADAFWNAGWEVRHYDRANGDMVAAAQGVDVIVNGLNPPNYHDWARNIPAITDQVIAAAKASGATVIIPGNIYVYGDQPGELNENTHHNAQTRKGKIRIAMEESYRASGVQTIILRAGNFIDPHGNGDIMSSLMMRDIKKGRLTAAADPATMQAYAFMPDWGRAALALAEKRAQLSQFEDIPFPGHAFTSADLQHCVERHLHRSVRVTRFPWWLMTMLSPFWELARELREMRYLFAMSHTIGSDKFNKVLPQFEPTDLETVMLAGLPRDIDPDEVVHTRRQPVLAK
ncbi:NAD-dependent epimerase/dehydratase family protein [Cognatiyoonia sp. IB215182]|uniref:NAD-dependent epimerase/dehydratase family protein n=1 Tax=Cognatiyoonia sp. IB215182 TaxID=3097353 RepID=UPI002A12A890|nr:NAD-dependent epimerase/dehydratase family protein [Cognatiyoonia sp. IB215182]MDX8351669.1 epimerase [Cognatiyoonia sp. IB215182]